MNKTKKQAFTDKFMAIGAKVAQLRHLAAIKDGFVTLTGLIIAAVIPLIIAIIFFQNNGIVGGMHGIKDSATMMDLNKYVGVPLWAAWNILMKAFSVLVAMLIGFFLTESYKRGQGVYGAMISVAAFFAFQPFASSTPDTNFIGQSGLIIAILSSLFAGTLYSKLSESKRLFVPMPASVPPVISKSFANIFVFVLTLAPFILFSYGFQWISEAAVWTGSSTSVDKYGVSTVHVYALTTLFDAIQFWLAAPLRAIGTNIGTTAVIAFLIALFWFFGIHGTNVMAAITNILWLPLMNENLLYWGEWVNGGSDIAAALTASTGVVHDYWNTALVGMNGLNEVPLQTLAYVGGTGGTLGMIIVILGFTKKSESNAMRPVAKFGIVPGVFGINEPIAFGIPIILNMIFAIPYIFGFVLLMVLSHLWIHLHWMRPAIINAPMLPFGFDSFVASNFDYRALLFALLHLVISFGIWFPFVKTYEKQQAAEYSKTNAEVANA